jgi:protein TonB
MNISQAVHFNEVELSSSSEHDSYLWIKHLLHIVYEKEYRSWFKKNRVYLALVLVTLVEVFFINYRFRTYSDSELDSLVVSVDLGEFINQQQQQSYIREIDEIFGNEFIKDKEKDEKEVLEYKVGTAVNPVTSDATMPVDLTPQIRPVYPAQARNAGIEGVLMLELVVDEDGKVLRAKPAGKHLGYGLEEAAVSAFRQKRFQPSLSKDGKPIVVKFYQPVQFEFI